MCVFADVFASQRARARPLILTCAVLLPWQTVAKPLRNIDFKPDVAKLLLETPIEHFDQDVG
jgi:hypothetical protein